MTRINLLSDRGPSPAIIKAETFGGEIFERQIPAVGRREVREWTLRTIENDPYLREVIGIAPGPVPRKALASYRRSGVVFGS